MIRILFLLASAIFFIGCSSKSTYESIELFSLENYLEDIKTNWSNESIERIYQSENLPFEQDQLKHSDFDDAFRIFSKYDINKPDYTNKYTIEVNGNIKTFTAVHDVPKVREFKVYGKMKTDSIYLEYVQESIIGHSRHIITANGERITISRSEKYMLSDSLKSQLIFQVE